MKTCLGYPVDILIMKSEEEKKWRRVFNLCRGPALTVIDWQSGCCIYKRHCVGSIGARLLIPNHHSQTGVYIRQNTMVVAEGDCFWKKRQMQGKNIFFKGKEEKEKIA